MAEKATFAAGCFWGVEDAFAALPGVLATSVGYLGGRTENPTYKDVCYNETGHAEAVEITFDPEKISYEQLLEGFWQIHDPTTLNRQGPDVGDQYRSAIFYHSPEQQAAAQESIRKQNEAGRYANPIVTEVVPAVTYWPAEEYHQKYFKKNAGYACHARIKL